MSLRGKLSPLLTEAFIEKDFLCGCLRLVPPRSNNYIAKPVTRIQTESKNGVT